MYVMSQLHTSARLFLTSIQSSLCFQLHHFTISVLLQHKYFPLTVISELTSVFFLSYSLLVPKMMNQSDQCKYISIQFATHLIYTELLEQRFELQLPSGDKLKTGSFLGKRTQQTTTRTKTFARGIQNKQFTQVRPC